MPDYSKGKIYTIRCRTDNTLIYVGSTVNPLSKRWGQHKGATISKKYDLYNCIEINGGFQNWFIELYENYSCESKEQLLRKEGEIIRLIGTLNSKIAGRSKKEYAEENKEKMDDYRKEWYIENRDELLERKKVYREEHKEEIIEKGKIYYIGNKDKILEQRKIKYTCICGSTISVCKKARHEKSNKHTTFINSNIL